ncbi:MAG: magnesium transporter [Pseudomonadales bacterium]|jgi:magnesium transporter|nr:magnesium transporter [Pseudomonadales bacterium]MDP4641339.1 magnesium transporter [Pseudomonadales bacterium]MDP4766337.1 magnesium transporter [Pseudomonadales bacterium]MDP4876413.1 magnesium transporter [Pseudomonadales bacterium]MDP4912458.1 magnesium transporter [Pseudomonadales bacterium]
MPDPTETRAPSPREILSDLFESGTYNQIKNLLDSLRPADIAALLESSPPKERTIIWNLIPDAEKSEILQQVDPDVIPDLLADKSAEELLPLLQQIVSADDLTDILQHLPDAITYQVLQSMDSQDRARVENLLSYGEDTAGGLMDTDTISVRPRVTLDVVLRYLRRHTELPPMTDNIVVVNSNDEYIGLLPISTLLVSDPSMTVREMMLTDIEPIQANTHRSEVAAIFQRYDLVSAPVVGPTGNLLGRITIDDVVDVIIDEADHSLLGMAGLTEDEDTFAPILKTARSRAVWLGANLMTAFLASAVINIFEETIAKVVALAVLMPIVASMGGVAGSQTLTLVIRSMAQGQLVESNQRWLMNRELAVGALNGLLWASIVAVAASLVFGDYMLGAIIATALIINLLVAALAGALLPGILKNLGIDPAIAGSVVLTTITDVVGFMTFLGLATLFYA